MTLTLLTFKEVVIQLTFERSAIDAQQRWSRKIAISKRNSRKMYITQPL